MKNLKDATFYILTITGFAFLMYFIVKKGEPLEITKMTKISEMADSNSWSQIKETLHHNITHPLAILLLQIITIIIISRIFLGISVGMSMTIVITLIADYFEGLERQKFVGLQVAFMSLGGILFIGLGGVLADISWRVPFLIYLFSLLVLPLSIIFPSL